MKYLLLLLASVPAFAAKQPQACPTGFESNFVCTAQSERDGQRSDENYRKVFPAVRVCQRAEGEKMLVQLTTPTTIYPDAKLNSVLGYGHYEFKFLDRDQERAADLTITVSRPPFPGQITVVGGEMVFYTCKR